MSQHNILKFFFIATQSVLQFRNDPFMIILEFGLSQTDTVCKTVELEISRGNIKLVINHLCDFLEEHSFGSQGSCLNEKKASLLLCSGDVQ